MTDATPARGVDRSHDTMIYSKTGAERRLKRLERILAGRRARLAATLAEQHSRRAVPGPIGGLQRYGYPVSLLLVLAAVLPTVVGFGVRRRRLLAGAAANVWGIRKLRKRFGAARSTGSDR